MRAGAFAEKSVIDLINRRFVPFYFNRGGPGKGHDEAASAFVRGKTRNPWAYLAAFHPDGRYIDESELYADEWEVYRWLLEQLDRFPEYATLKADEKRLFDASEKPEADPTTLVAAAQCAEEMGRTEQAIALLDRVPPGDPVMDVARPVLARLLRRSGDHQRHQSLCREMSGMDRALEEAYGMMHRNEWGPAQALLESAIRQHRDHPRQAEARCYAGKSCFQQGQVDRAKYHWMWVVNHLPNDRFYMRCKIAAAADRMPYPNSLLDGYSADVGNIGPHNIQNAVAQADQVFRAYVNRLEGGDAVEDPQPRPWSSGPAGQLVARLKDGNAHVVSNNETVEALIALGEAALVPLHGAVEDPAYEGRGYAAFALARLLEGIDPRPAESVALLDRLCEDQDAYVQLLALSGRQRLLVKSEGAGSKAPVPTGTAQEKVRRLQDGNPHVPTNNRIVRELEILGEAAIQPLVDAIRDPEFSGRGYAAWALALTLAGSGTSSDVAREVLQQCEEDPDDYVQALSQSGLRVLVAASEKLHDLPICRVGSPMLLVAAMNDDLVADSRNAALATRLRHLGERSVPVLRAALGDADYPGRRAACHLLAEILSARGLKDLEVEQWMRQAARGNDQLAETAQHGLRLLGLAP